MANHLEISIEFCIVILLSPKKNMVYFKNNYLQYIYVPTPQKEPPKTKATNPKTGWKPVVQSSKKLKKTHILHPSKELWNGLDWNEGAWPEVLEGPETGPRTQHLHMNNGNTQSYAME